MKHQRIIKLILTTLLIVLTISTLSYLKLSKDSKINTVVSENQKNENITKETIQTEAPLAADAEKEPVQTPEVDFSQYGNFTIKGMTTKDYKAFKNLQWTRIKSEGKPEDLEIDLTRQYTYKELEDFMINLAKYDNVYLDIIGKTQQGRNIYSLSIDYTNVGSVKDVVLNTGQTHALEFAGGVYILKQYSDLIRQAQTDPSVRLKLENVTFHAIPIVNPDGREMIINGGDARQKSNANGVDLNRSFNSINAGQQATGINLNTTINTTPGLGNFPGYTLGSESETQAVMKWIETYITTNKGKVYLFDYHQMGRVAYSDKPWRPLSLENLTKNVQEEILNFLNKGVVSNHYAYAPEDINYGLDGVGGTLTDYFVSIADGFKFSEQYGRVMYEVNGAKMPLIQFKDLDRVINSYKPANPNCIAMTLEIGSSDLALGYGTTARNLMNKEYTDYHFNALLTFLADLIHR